MAASFVMMVKEYRKVSCVFVFHDDTDVRIQFGLFYDYGEIYRRLNIDSCVWLSPTHNQALLIITGHFVNSS